MSKHDELQSIDPSILNGVTGGNIVATSSTSTDVMTMLTSIEQSIQQLANPQASGGSSQQMMMQMMMMLMQGRQGAPVAAQPATGGFPWASGLPTTYY